MDVPSGKMGLPPRTVPKKFTIRHCALGQEEAIRYHERIFRILKQRNLLSWPGLNRYSLSGFYTFDDRLHVGVGPTFHEPYG